MSPELHAPNSSPWLALIPPYSCWLTSLTHTPNSRLLLTPLTHTHTSLFVLTHALNPYPQLTPLTHASQSKLPIRCTIHSPLWKPLARGVPYTFLSWGGWRGGELDPCPGWVGGSWVCTKEEEVGRRKRKGRRKGGSIGDREYGVRKNKQ